MVFRSGHLKTSGPLVLNSYEQFLLNLLSFINILIGIGLLPAIVAHCYKAGLKHLAYWPDFMVYYTAGHMVRLAPESLYNYPSYLDFYQTLKPWPYAAWFGYIAPPSVAVLLSPLSLLDFDQAFLVWGIFNLTLCLILARGVFLLAKRLALQPIAFFLGSCAVGIWVTSTIIGKGQLSLVTGVGLVYFLLAMEQKQPLRSALWLTLILQIKAQLFIPLFLYSLGCRQWRLVTLTGLFSLICMGVTSALLGVHIWPEYLSVLHRYSQTSIDHYTQGMINLPGILYSVAGVTMRSTTTLFYFALSLLCAVWPFACKRSFDLLGAAMVIALGLLLSSYSLIHDIIILLPVAVITTAALVNAQGKACWMFPCYLFASYLAYPTGFFARVNLVIVCIATVGLCIFEQRRQTVPLAFNAAPDRPGE